MRITLYYLLGLIFITSCSAPKYAYHFDHYDYRSGKKTKIMEVGDIDSKPMSIQPELLVASKERAILVTEPIAEISNNEVRKTYAQMTKVERKEFRSDLKKYIKEKKETVKATKKTNAMDNDLKLAAVFGAVGLVALIISGDVFYIIGGIALIIGVVFFVKWLVRQ